MNQAKTLEGLKVLAALFPADAMPAKATTRCTRCHMDYNPQLPSDRACRIEHPDDQVSETLKP